MGEKHTGSWLLESSDGGNQNSYRVMKAQKKKKKSVTRVCVYVARIYVAKIP